MIATEFRPLSNKEVEILHKMISKTPSDAKFLVSQIQRARVKITDEYGSLKFLIKSNLHCEGREKPFVMARQPDSDTVLDEGPYINLILFLRGDIISELQIFKDDGTPIKSNIDPDMLELMYNIHPKSEIK